MNKGKLVEILGWLFVVMVSCIVLYYVVTDLLMFPLREIAVFLGEHLGSATCFIVHGNASNVSLIGRLDVDTVGLLLRSPELLRSLSHTLRENIEDKCISIFLYNNTTIYILFTEPVNGGCNHTRHMNLDDYDIKIMVLAKPLGNDETEIIVKKIEHIENYPYIPLDVNWG